MIGYDILVHEAVRQEYESFDVEIARLLGESDLAVSCAKGCSGCCYQFVHCGFSEAYYIICEMTTWPDWREWLRRLAHAARAMLCEDVTIASWFARAIPCAFLRPDRLCAIYERRPVVCRYYVAFSPAENCRPGAVDGRVRTADFRAVPQRFALLDLEVIRSNPALAIPLHGPLPAMVLLAWSAATKRTMKHLADKRLRRLPPISEWARLLGGSSGLRVA